MLMRLRCCASFARCAQHDPLWREGLSGQPSGGFSERTRQPAFAGSRCRERSVQWRTLCIPCEAGGPDQDRLVGRQRRVSVCKAPGEILVLLAAHRTCPGPAQSRPADGASGWSRLEAGPPRCGQNACICWIIRLRPSESIGLCYGYSAPSLSGTCYVQWHERR